MALAVDSYRHVGVVADRPGLLDLAWTVDERELLRPDLQAVLQVELAAEGQEGLAFVNTYFVQDPYGHEVLAPAVAHYFGVAEASLHVTCGAGVISLLHALARLGGHGPVQVVGDTYPDFPHWVAELGKPCSPCSGHVKDRAMIFAERPGLLDDPLADPHSVIELCAEAAARGGVVVLDESNANYCPPGYSAVHVLPAASNLVVIRGFSKAYGLGGLRLAYCLTGEDQRSRVRSVVPPLQASSLSLRLGRRVLTLGDVAVGLRARIAAHKPAMAEVLAASGLVGVTPAAAPLPYLLLPDRYDEVRCRIEGMGVRGKLHSVWSAGTGRTRSVYRMSVPLTARRLQTLRRRLGTRG